MEVKQKIRIIVLKVLCVHIQHLICEERIRDAKVLFQKQSKFLFAKLTIRKS